MRHCGVSVEFSHHLCSQMAERGFVYRGVGETACHPGLKHQESLTAVKEQTEGGYMNGCLATELGSFQLWFPVRKRRALLSLSIQRLSPVIYQLNVHECVCTRAVANRDTAKHVSTPVCRLVGFSTEQLLELVSNLNYFGGGWYTGIMVVIWAL